MTRAHMSYNLRPSMIDMKSDSKTRLLVYRKTKNDKKRKRKVASNIGVGSFSLRGYLSEQMHHTFSIPIGHNTKSIQFCAH